MPFTFLEPVFFLLIILLVPMLWYARRRHQALGHSRVSSLKGTRIRSIPLIAILPMLLFSLSWSLLAAGMADPVVPHTSQHTTIDSRDIIVSMDISGSMGDTISASGSTGCSGANAASALCQPIPGATKPLRKLDLASAAIRYFVEQRKGDRVALNVFDDTTYWYWPLTNDLNIIIKKTYLLNSYLGGGTNFDGPAPDEYETGIGPIQSAIDHFKQYGQSKTKIFVMVTDGGAPIEPSRFAQLSHELEQMGVHMYVLGVGDDWTSHDPSTNDLRRFVKTVGGTLIDAGNARELQAGIDSINGMEPSQVKIQENTSYQSIEGYFLLAAVLALLGFLGASYINRQPV